MRFPIAWASATWCGLVGYLMAATIVVGLDGWYWVFLPALIASAPAVYGASTWLGTLAERKSHQFLVAVAVGIGVALTTLIAGAVAVGAVNVLLSWVDEVTSAGLGLGPYYSIWASVRAYLINPTAAALIFGGWIAVILGVAYGLQLYLKG